MTTKPDLEKQLLELQDSYDGVLQDVRATEREYEIALEKTRDLKGDVESCKEQILWYEREREQTLLWFEQSLRLLAPHLVPNPHTSDFSTSPNKPDERLLVEMRQRLSRVYDPRGRKLHREGSY